MEFPSILSFAKDFSETEFPDLPENLEILLVSNCKLSEFPPLHHLKNLTQIDCADNQLTSLPPLPPNLQGITCGRNELTNFPIYLQIYTL